MWTWCRSPITIGKRSDDSANIRRHVEVSVPETVRCHDGGSCDSAGTIGQDSRILGNHRAGRELETPGKDGAMFHKPGLAITARNVASCYAGRYRNDSGQGAALVKGAIRNTKDHDQAARRSFRLPRRRQVLAASRSRFRNH